MKIAIYSRKITKQSLVFINEVIHEISSRNWQVLVEAEMLDVLVHKHDFSSDLKSYDNHNDFKEGVDLMISLGGDGTFLKAVRFIRDSGVPILGINTGRLGFLSNISKEAIKETFSFIENKEFEFQTRSLIKIETPDSSLEEESFALNELTIIKRDTATMITVHAKLDGKFLNSYWADGLIISTPTGSTAYSLSCGGPIITPGCEVHIITPIAAHNLNVRPVVVPDHLEIELTVEGRERSFLMSIDGNIKSVKQGERIVVKKANFMINVLKFEHTNFLDTIRNKMYWGIDNRN